MTIIIDKGKFSGTELKRFDDAGKIIRLDAANDQYYRIHCKYMTYLRQSWELFARRTLIGMDQSEINSIGGCHGSWRRRRWVAELVNVMRLATIEFEENQQIFLELDKLCFEICVGRFGNTGSMVLVADDGISITINSIELGGSTLFLSGFWGVTFFFVDNSLKLDGYIKKRS